MLGLPLLGGLRTRLLGHALSEHTSHLWVQWLLGRAASGEGPWLGQTGILSHEQLWLMPNDPLNRTLTAVLQPLLGLIGATNAVVLFQLGLAAVATSALAREVGARTGPATLAGLFVLLHPSLLGFAADGRMDSLGVGWTALLAVFWLRGLRNPSWTRGLALGACGIAVVLMGPNHVIATALALSLPSLWWLVRRPRVARTLAPAAVLAGAVAAALLAVFLHIEAQGSSRLSEQVTTMEAELPSVWAETTWASVTGQRQADIWVGTRKMHQAARVQSLWQLEPAVSNQSSLVGPLREEFVLQTYSPGGWTWPGVVPWVVAVLGLVVHRRRALPWWLAGVALWLTSFGWGSAQSLPIEVGGRLFYFAPAALLSRLPGLAAFNNYGLFGPLSAVCIAVVGALGLSRRGTGAPVMAGLALLWLVEVQHSPTPVPLPVTDIDVSPGLIDRLRALPENASVMVFPINRGTNSLLQIWHEHPTPQRFWSVPNTNPASSAHPMLADPDGIQSKFVFQVLGRVRRGAPTGAEDLAKDGIGAVLFLSGLLPQAQDERIPTRLSQQLKAPPTWTGAEGDLWVLDAPTHTTGN